jgi:hypothetical protein
VIGARVPWRLRTASDAARARGRGSGRRSADPRDGARHAALARMEERP